MRYAKFSGIRDPLKQYLVLQFCRNQNKGVSIFTETHITIGKIHYRKNNWLGHIFFFPEDSHTKGLHVLLNLGLEGVTEADTDPKGRSMSFKVTPSNDRVFCVYAPSGHSTTEQLARRRFFEGLKNYMENTNDGNENKIILGDFNFIMDKMERDGGNKTRFIDVASIMPCHRG